MLDIMAAAPVVSATSLAGSLGMAVKLGLPRAALEGPAPIPARPIACALR
jgi:hypothetical protein